MTVRRRKRRRKNEKRYENDRKKEREKLLTWSSILLSADLILIVLRRGILFVECNYRKSFCENSSKNLYFYFVIYFCILI